VTRYAPGDTEATTNEPARLPPEIEQLSDVMIVPLSVQDVSVDEKPEPVTETADATLPEFGVNVIDAAALEVPKVSVAELESSSGVPVAVTV